MSSNRFSESRKFQHEESSLNSGNSTDFTPLVVVGGALIIGGLGARALYRTARQLGKESAKEMKETQEAFQKSRENFKNPFAGLKDLKNNNNNGKSDFKFEFKTINLKNIKDSKNSKEAQEAVKKDLEKMLKQAANQKNFTAKNFKKHDTKKLFEDIMEKAIKAMEGEEKKPPKMGKDGQPIASAGPEKDFFDKALDKVFGEEGLDKQVNNDKKDAKKSSSDNGPQTAPDPRGNIKKHNNSESSASTFNISGIIDNLLGEVHLKGGFEESSKQGMSLTESKRILQFEINGPSPSKDQIMENFRFISRANHPDLGGSAYLAAKINEAKDVMLKDTKKNARRRR